MSVRPKLFIGSAKESIHIANAVNSALSHFAEISAWYSGTFNAMKYPMEDLEAKLTICDFAVFILSPDDVLSHREKLVLAPRDNTIFEMGLFWGKLKRGRVFFIKPTTVSRQHNGKTIDEFHILSDMDGLTVLNYDSERSDGSYKDAVSVACMTIGEIIKEKGVYQDPVKALEVATTQMEQDLNVFRFFLKYVKESMSNTGTKYEWLYEAIRDSYYSVDDFKVVGAAIWKANDTLEQVAGDVGKGKSFDFSINQGKSEEKKIAVVDAYHNSKIKMILLSSNIVTTYLICYPVGKDLLIGIHISGRRELSEQEIKLQVDENNKLITTINHLFGGEV
jgi:Predicted nucleotide-binding protein containing TIR-like domain